MENDISQKNNSEILSIFDKYKLQNAEGSSNDIKENIILIIIRMKI